MLANWCWYSPCGSCNIQEHPFHIDSLRLSLNTYVVNPEKQDTFHEFRTLTRIRGAQLSQVTKPRGGEVVDTKYESRDKEQSVNVGYYRCKFGIVNS